MGVSKAIYQTHETDHIERFDRIVGGNGQRRPASRAGSHVTRSGLPPIQSVAPREGLQVVDRPIARIIPHANSKRQNRLNRCAWPPWDGADLSRLDYGEAVPIRPDDVPLLWACVVTSPVALQSARLPLFIAHAPGCMLITDLTHGSVGG
jgi:hypothetical protein